ncbi:efflux RND transporter periplasmic adaptor subunit [Piscinibacter sakaiensis]|uniref:efflux RND transporter periplasmic adaptor subunit n=1 Tax=Piscinibacter sakaiensis TaxID=1547922 RepID=UPI003727A104
MRVIQTLAVAASVAAAVLSAACSKPAPPPEPVRAVRTIELRAGDGAPSIDYAAEIRARTETRLSFRVGGKLVERRVDLGDRVRAGQPVARLDPQDLRLGQDNARAALAAAEASLELAQADFRRYRDLRDQGFISFAELERRETTLKSAQAQQRQAQAQAAVQANQASYASLVADAAGVVAEPGAVLAAGAPVLRLALLPATLREIAAAADPVTRTFLAKADLGAAANAAVRLGQTATVRLRLPATGAALRLPLAALKEEQGRSIVWLVDRASMTVRAQPVQLGGADGNEVIVASGLQPGQWVVTAGVHVLRPGQKVTLYGAAPAGAASAAAAPGTASSGAGR